MDERKTTEIETGRYEKKIADQDNTIRELREKLKEYEAGAVELNKCMNCILAELAVRYGEEKDGVYELVLPNISANDKYEVHTAKGENGGTVTTARLRAADAD